MITSDRFYGKTYYVFGLGRTGVGAVNSLAASGAKVYAWDDNENNRKQPTLETKASLIEPENIPWQEIESVVLSPGIPLNGPHAHKIVGLALGNDTRIISDLDLLYIACPNANYIGITGTNGKSTTTALVGHILRECGQKVCVGGNIGISVMEMEQLAQDGAYVIEASSYQLDLIQNIRFNIAALLNITPDHLDRHLNMENYVNAKAKIFSNQTKSDYSIISIDYPETANLANSIPDCIKISLRQPADIYVKNDKIVDGNLAYDISGLKYLPGKHNQENILVAYVICRKFGVRPQQIIDKIKTFKGLEHRIEIVLQKDDVTFINDSKATNADAAQKALECFDNIYWILGGVDKTDGIDSLKPLMSKIRKAYLIGKAQDRFEKTLSEVGCQYMKCGDLEKSLIQIKRDNITSGNVLLSPACASFDQFKDFEERGRVFKRLVKTQFG